MSDIPHVATKAYERRRCNGDQEAGLRQQLWTLVHMTRNLLDCVDVGAQGPVLNGALGGAVEGAAWEIIQCVFNMDAETIKPPGHRVSRLKQRMTHVHIGNDLEDK